MQKSYIETSELRTCQCDLSGEWRPSAILETLQETATTHSNMLGVGRADTLRAGLVWVLSRLRVEMKRLPVIGESVSVETWPTPQRHLFFPRASVIRGPQGEEIGAAMSLWVLMDVETRRIAGNADIAARMPDNTDRPMPLGMPATIRMPEGGAERSVIEPQYADLDLNGHVNNTKYLDWCCNALGIDALRRGRLLRFGVSYEAEIRPGSRVETSLARRDGAFTFCGELEGRRSFAVAGELAPRNGCADAGDRS